jgi:hypothetical protein
MIQKTRRADLLGSLITSPDQAIYRCNAVLELAAAEDLGAMDIPSSQVGPGTAAKILVLDPRVGRRSRNCILKDSRRSHARV